MIVNIDLMFLYELIFGFAGGGFFIGFILPLIMGGKPVRVFFSAKLRKKPVQLITRPDKTMIAGIPSYLADLWRVQTGRKQYGLYQVYPDSILDFYGVRVAISDTLSNKILPPIVYKVFDKAHRLGYKTREEFLQALHDQITFNNIELFTQYLSKTLDQQDDVSEDDKKKILNKAAKLFSEGRSVEDVMRIVGVNFNPDTLYNANTDYVSLEPSKIIFIRDDNAEANMLNGEAIRINDLEKMFKPGESSAFLAELENKVTAIQMRMQRTPLLNYIGIGLMLLFTFIGLAIFMQIAKNMGWLGVIHSLVMSLV